MKVIAFLLFLSSLLLSCGSGGEKRRITLQVQDSIIALGDTFHAEIHVLDTAARFQQFFVIQSGDTARLPVTPNWKVCLLQVIGQRLGPRTMKGFARIEHSDSTVVFIEPFQVTFHVE